MWQYCDITVRLVWHKCDGDVEYCDISVRLVWQYCDIAVTWL